MSGFTDPGKPGCRCRDAGSSIFASCRSPVRSRAIAVSSGASTPEAERNTGASIVSLLVGTYGVAYARTGIRPRASVTRADDLLLLRQRQPRLAGCAIFATPRWLLPIKTSRPGFLWTLLAPGA